LAERQEKCLDQVPCLIISFTKRTAAATAKINQRAAIHRATIF
jgi:hypothetical protein